MKKSLQLVSILLLSVFLVACGGTPISFGEYTFTLPSSWEVQSESENQLMVNFEQGGEIFSFTIDYQVTTEEEAQGLLSGDSKEDIQFYEVSPCEGFLCYGIISDKNAAVLTFTETGDSSISKYDLYESVQKFSTSAE